MKLNINGICFSYPGNSVLDNISFEAKKGEFIAVLGTNGTGKSTFLKCINLILKPQNGNIILGEKCTREYSRNELAQKISYVEQRKTGSKMDVFNSVLLGRKPYINWDVSNEDISIAQEAIQILNLKEYEDRYIDELSGGELQKVMIARAIAQTPSIMLMDEPTNHLDLKNQLEVLDTVKNIVLEKKITAIVAIHDINLALRYADRFILMKDKKIYAAGDKEVITSENLEEVYSVSVNIINYENYKIVVPK